MLLILVLLTPQLTLLLYLLKIPSIQLPLVSTLELLLKLHYLLSPLHSDCYPVLFHMMIPAERMILFLLIDLLLYPQSLLNFRHSFYLLLYLQHLFHLVLKNLLYLLLYTLLLRHLSILMFDH